MSEVPPITEVRPITPAGIHGANRLFEWVVSGMMLMIGFTLAMPGEVASDPLNVLVKSGVASEEILAFFFCAIAMVRIMALWANGRIPTHGPRARAICSAVAALIWSQMALASVWVGTVAGQTTLAAAIYGSLTIGELLSCYRATYDAGRRGHL